MTVIQSVRFAREFFTIDRATNILNNRVKLSPIKPIDITRNQFRFRILEPNIFFPGSFRTLKDKRIKGLTYVVGELKLDPRIKKFVKPGKTKRRTKLEKKFPSKQIIEAKKKFDIKKEIRKQKQFTIKPKKKREPFEDIGIRAFPFRR